MPAATEQMTWTQEQRWEDLELYVRARMVNDYVVEFEVMSLVLYDDGDGHALKFQKKEQSTFVPTLDPNEAETLVTGSIKWDGCSHINFTHYIHACDRDELTRLGPLFDRLYDMAAKMMPDTA